MSGPAWAPDAYPQNLPPLTAELAAQKRADCKRAVLELFARDVADRTEEGPRSMRRMRLALYKGVSANDVAHYLGVPGARRAGRGAVKGSWSGYMSPALRVQGVLRSLVKAGELGGSSDNADYRWHFYPPGREPWRLTIEEDEV